MFEQSNDDVQLTQVCRDFDDLPFILQFDLNFPRGYIDRFNCIPIEFPVVSHMAHTKNAVHASEPDEEVRALVCQDRSSDHKNKNPFKDIFCS